MANTITKTVIEDGPRNLVILVNVAGDNSGNETGYLLVDRSAHAPDGTKLAVTKVEGLLGGFSATLRFDATADLTIVALPETESFCFDWSAIGGISSSKAGEGANGDILLATAGLASENGTFTIHMRKS
jgi:hypothetical protein